MSILLFCSVIFCAFFAQSVMGFGGGLIAIPLLSLFMPVQDVVAVVMLFQLSMGWLLFKTWHGIHWSMIVALVPALVVGSVLGLISLNYVSPDVMRLLLAGYLVLHLLRSHTPIDLLGYLIHKGGAHFCGLLGGYLNALIGGGGPAVIVYFREKIKDSAEFRANAMAIMFLSNIPRLIGTVSMGMLTMPLWKMALIAYPVFISALLIGQRFHAMVPQKIFFMMVEAILACTAISLLIKAVI